MTGKDLENGMIVELRNGRRYMVLSCGDYTIGFDMEKRETITLYSCGICDYTLLLKNKLDREKDVVQIGRVPVSEFTREMWANSYQIWKRDEPKKMTISEICKELGYEVEIVKE